jgi:hypothetical protein
MRHIVPVVLLAGACRGPELFLDPRVEIAAEDRGVALSDDGELGHVAMRDTTCSFDAQEGMILGDVNLPGDQERVLDGWRGEVLASSDEGVHLLDRTSELAFFPGVPARASLTDRGALGLDTREGCELRWYEEDLSVVLPAQAWQGPLAATRSGELAFVTVDGRLWSADERGLVRELGGAAERLSWDERYGQLVAAEGALVSAYDAAGELSWETEVEGTIDALFRFADGIGIRHGETWLALRPESGEEKARLSDGPRGEASSSSDGTTITVSLFGLITIYEIHVGSVRPPRNREPQRLFD